MNSKQLLYKCAMPIRKLYWRIFKPKTFGVKVLIMHPENPNKALFVLNSYGNTTLWNLPGGGYNPAKESAEAASRREVSQETGMEISSLIELGEYRTTAEGKIDTVTMFKTVVQTEQVKINAELSEARWIKITKARQSSKVAKVAKRAIDLSS